jgi:alkanesulfonate monooxygenase SsuD/methylene tetrahydromethanopterin reductase-like flavin-dependent oxidoreductase (luciferase family)
LESGDGWLASSRNPGQLAADWEEIISYVDAHGRNPATVEKIGLNWLHLVPGVEASEARAKQQYLYEAKDGADRDVMSRYLTGTVSDVHDQLTEYERAGFDEVIVGPVVHEPTQVETQFNYYLDHLDAFL